MTPTPRRLTRRSASKSTATSWRGSKAGGACAPPTPPPPDRVEEHRHLVAGQHGGGLVDHQHPRLLGIPKRAGDRDPGPLRRRELAHRPSWVDVVAELAHP